MRISLTASPIKYFGIKKTSKNTSKNSNSSPLGLDTEAKRVPLSMHKTPFQTVKDKIQLDKIKRDIYREYEILADETAKKMEKMGYAFEKPKLVFQKINDAPTRANYSSDFNTITVDPYFNSHERIRSRKYKLPTAITGYLVHEMQHAINTQITLHAEGVKDMYLDGLQKLNPDVSREELARSVSFVLDFKPKRIISLDEPIPYCNFEFCIADGYEDKINPAKIRRVSKNTYIPLFAPREMFGAVFVGKELTKEEYFSSINEVLAHMLEVDVFQKIGFSENDNSFDKYIAYLKKRTMHYLFKYLES